MYYVGGILLCFGFCVGLIDFAVNFCCAYQCRWLPGERLQNDL